MKKITILDDSDGIIRDRNEGVSLKIPESKKLKKEEKSVCEKIKNIADKESPDLNILNQEKEWVRHIFSLLRNAIKEKNRRLSPKLVKKEIMPFLKDAGDIVQNKINDYDLITSHLKEINKYFKESKKIINCTLKEILRKSIIKNNDRFIENCSLIEEKANEIIKICNEQIRNSIVLQKNNIKHLRKKINKISSKTWQGKMQEEFLKEHFKKSLNQYLNAIKETKKVFKGFRKIAKKDILVVEKYKKIGRKLISNIKKAA